MSNTALARFAESVGRAYLQLGSDLRADLASAPVAGQSPTLLAPLGTRQKEILTLFEPGANEELTTREIAEAIGLDTANTWNTVRRLETMGHLQLVPSSRPQRWRLVR